MIPPPCSRSTGMAALETLWTPQKLVSNCARKSSSVVVSIGDTFA